MRREWSVVALSLFVSCALLRLVGCSVDSLDLSSKRCPCTAGWVCDDMTSTCVLAGTKPIPTADGTTTPPQPPLDAPAGGFVVQTFAATWRTSRSVAWQWTVSGDPTEFAEYRIVIAPTMDGVLKQDSTATVFDPLVNPELATYGVNTTITDRNIPNTPSFARLIVRDRAGRENASEILTVTMLPEITALVLFDSNLLPDTAVTPPELLRSTTACFGSSAGCLQLASVGCAADAGSCSVEIGLASVGSKALTGLNAKAFENAFLEIAVRGGREVSIEQLDDLILGIGTPSCRIGTRRCRFRGYGTWSFRPAPTYRIVQIPLRLLQLDTGTGPGANLTFADMQANGLAVESLTIIGTWTARSDIGVDRLTLRW